MKLTKLDCAIMVTVIKAYRRQSIKGQSFDRFVSSLRRRLLITHRIGRKTTEGRESQQPWSPTVFKSVQDLCAYLGRLEKNGLNMEQLDCELDRILSYVPKLIQNEHCDGSLSSCLLKLFVLVASHGHRCLHAYSTLIAIYCLQYEASSDRRRNVSLIFCLIQDVIHINVIPNDALVGRKRYEEAALNFHQRFEVPIFQDCRSMENLVSSLIQLLFKVLSVGLDEKLSLSRELKNLQVFLLGSGNPALVRKFLQAKDHLIQ